jgi:serine/threonine protein kinase
VKFLWRRGSPEVLERFLREGRLLLSLRHPNLIEVYEFTEIGQHSYLVCEYAAGGSLKDRLATCGRLEAEEAVTIAIHVLHGLAECHRHGIVHRDVKPANVLLDGAGWAKLADLGIAKLPATDVRLTVTGTVLGTPVYMSPEQVIGEEATAASDIYAAAVTLYELLAGRPPFTETNLARLAARHEQPLQRLESLVPAAADGLGQLVHEALERDPAHRPASAEAFARSLVAWRDRRAPAGQAPRPSTERELRSGAGRNAAGWLVALGALLVTAPLITSGLSLAIPWLADRQLALACLWIGAGFAAYAAIRRDP